MALKIYEAFFDHIMREPCGRKIDLVDKKKSCQICFYIIQKVIKFHISSSHIPSLYRDLLRPLNREKG